MKLLFRFDTAKGPVFIGQSPDGRFHPVWDHEKLGSYWSAEQAVVAVANGHCDSAFNVSDFSELGISEDINDWSRQGLPT